MRTRERKNDSRYKQFEISPKTIEQELRPVVCEQRHTDMFEENYNIIDIKRQTNEFPYFTMYNTKHQL